MSTNFENIVDNSSSSQNFTNTEDCGYSVNLQILKAENSGNFENSTSF